MIKAAIIGGTGYTGVELIRLLSTHPEVSLEAVTSRACANQLVADVFPNLRGHVNSHFRDPASVKFNEYDIVFFATPNGTAMTMAPALLDAGVRVIDLAADFRLKDADAWEQWYGMPHACPDLLQEAVYGLPEVNREAIGKARLIANPGCYPTSVQLGFLPLIENNLVNTNNLIADAKSGASGAGRTANTNMLLGEISENVKAYAVPGHRHLPEIRQGLTKAAGHEVGLTFVPHLMPMIRGIHATLYATLKDSTVDLQAIYENHYVDEPFVDVMPHGSHPETRSVSGTNVCRMSAHKPRDSDTVVILSIIDNLVKGAAGQAVQNMNIMFSLEETMGLEGIAVLP